MIIIVLKFYLIGIAIIIGVYALKLIYDEMVNAPDCYKCVYADFRAGCPPFGVYCNKKRRYCKDACEYYEVSEAFK